ncbi:hypothetical protein PMIN01_02961 [Paraphaeosphaeria minitans]|uniref:Uncharacterized protein n=1 Tax=Paraphaeosphaeria minitans TaxID=565426 RepID=A0A9P6GS19_9PLEO|nr:hypothetical protein PMIN01_02961 [Paraphaeosphaeria minitans]
MSGLTPAEMRLGGLQTGGGGAVERWSSGAVERCRAAQLRVQSRRVNGVEHSASEARWPTGIGSGGAAGYSIKAQGMNATASGAKVRAKGGRGRAGTGIVGVAGGNLFTERIPTGPPARQPVSPLSSVERRDSNLVPSSLWTSACGCVVDNTTTAIHRGCVQTPWCSAERRQSPVSACTCQSWCGGSRIACPLPAARRFRGTFRPRFALESRHGAHDAPPGLRCGLQQREQRFKHPPLVADSANCVRSKYSPLATPDGTKLAAAGTLPPRAVLCSRNWMRQRQRHVTIKALALLRPHHPGSIVPRIAPSPAASENMTT